MFFDRLARAFAASTDRTPPVALLLIDLDDFRRVDSSFGHDAADRLLATIGERIEGAAAPDVAERLGGDEFAVLIERANRHDASDAALDAARRLVDAIGATAELDGQRISVGASVGIAVPDRDVDGPQQLLRHAESALHRAKAAGRRQIQTFDGFLPPLDVDDPACAEQLKLAMPSGQLELSHLPVVDLMAGARMVGAEALVRWNHPARGVTGAGEILGVAAQHHLLGPLNGWVLGEACRHLAIWSAAGELPDGFFLTVNVAGPVFMRADLHADVQRALRSARIAESHLQVEVAERDVVDEVDAAGHQFAALRTMGVRVSLDGYGVGGLRLGQLERLNVNTVKLSPLLVRAVEDDHVADSVVRDLVNMASHRGMLVVAVGVESDRQRAALVGLGVRYAEGFGFTRPLDADELGRLLALGAAA
ncbi:MAG: bifunctional diguanylate cyclase/phosphodiesterase [Actinobacteria bacterium]|nr:bifunctional diguanylate cyclase/phosphodiesterase [Actinomycetota bacterium]